VKHKTPVLAHRVYRRRVPARRGGRGVLITDSLPVSLTVTHAVNSGAAIMDTGAGATTVRQVQDLAAGEGDIITTTGVLNDALPDGYILTNTATITTTTADSDVSDNSSSARVMVIAKRRPYRLCLPAVLRDPWER
jgi:hypothetical protein